jgi:hypothetical protein
VPRLARERRFLEAVRERVLDPELVRFVVERTVQTVAPHDPVADRRRVAEVETELANRARFAEKTGRVEEPADRYAELDEERRVLVGPPSRRPAALEQGAIAAKVEARVREFRGGLDGSPKHGRGILRALLGGDRIRVASDGERDFRLERTLWLEVEAGTAGPHEANGRFHSQPAGGQSDRLPTPAITRLQPEWAWAAKRPEYNADRLERARVP